MFRSFYLALVAAMALVIATPASAQVVVQAGGAGGGARANYPSGQSLMYLLYYPQLQKEIEIIDDQKAELQKIQAESQAKMTEAYKTMNDQAAGGDALQRQQKYMELYQTLGKETEEKVAKVLLPHQKKRLSQIMLQMKLSQSSYGYGFAGALEGDDVGKELGITDAQREELKKKEEKIRAEFMKKYQEFYKKLNEETKEEMMSVLTPAQKKKLEDLLGEKFEMQQPQYGQQPLKKDAKGD